MAEHRTNRPFFGALLGSTIVLGGAAGAVFAQTAPAQTVRPAAPASDAAVSEVTVVGKVGRGALKPTTRGLRIDPTSAGSCNYSASEDSYIEHYLSAITGTAHRPYYSQMTEVDTYGAITRKSDNYFSATSPFGDASTEGTEDDGAACKRSDRTVVAGRAMIAIRDKTLPQGYALFNDGRYAEALAMFRKAYDKLPDADGGVDASLMIGKVYLDRLGAQSNPAEAVTWLKKAAGARFNPGDRKDMPAFDPRNPSGSMTPISDAAMTLATVYMVGQGVPKDPKAARRWFERANEVGYVPAAKTLGDIHYYGYDTPRDVKEAARYYRQAATLGFAPAQYALAEIHYRGELGQPDIKTALAWYNEAAKVDHPGAQYALALAYDTGEGVAADPQKALALYKAAAMGGSIDAQSAMGTYFYQGEMVAKDHAVARRWFQAAAVRGQTDAMFNLGAMLMKGEGGEKDLVKAWVWFNIAKKGRHPKAAAALAALEKRMTGDEIQAAADIYSPKKAG